MMTLEVLSGIEKKYWIVILEEMLTSLNQTVSIDKNIVARKK